MLVRTSITTLFTLLLSGSILPAVAATEGRETPSNLAVWIFLGFCALIIIAQLGTLLRRGSQKHSRDVIEQDEAAEHSKSH